MTSSPVELVSAFLAGLLAGEELVIRYGVRGPIAMLDPTPQIQLRQALIRRLRILVPAIFLPTLLTAIAALAVSGAGDSFAFRGAGVAALLTFIGVTLAGTVPINKGMLAWRLDALPSDWREIIRRWERLDTVRCWAAIAAFAFLLVAMGVHAS